jgi:hypothetical protein
MITPLETQQPSTTNSRGILADILSYLRKLTQYQNPVTLTDGATVTWYINKSYNAQVTLAGSRTLVIAGLTQGDYGTLKIIQGGAGSYALTLPNPSKVSGAGAGALTLSTAVGSIDIATFYYDGTTLFWNLSTDFT